MKQRGNVGKVKRVGAWLLTFVMLLSLVMVPVGKVEAADLVTVTNATEGTKPVYVKIEVEEVIKAYSNADGTWPTQDLTQYKAAVINRSGGTISDWQVTIQSPDASSWNAGWNGVTRSGNTITIGTYKGTDQSTGEVWTNAEIADGKSADGAGFQIAASAIDGATVTLTYHVGESSGTPSVDDTATDPSVIGQQSDKVKAVFTQSNVAGEYHEYYLKINNQTSDSIGDWIVAVPIKGVTKVEDWSSWSKIKTCYTSDYLYIAPVGSAVIPAGGSFGSTSEETIKFNYYANSEPSNAVVYYKTGTSSSNAFDSVINNATGGSSVGGGTGGSGGVQGDTTTDLNLDVEYNFAKLLQESLYFYDANMCGELEGKCALDWRQNCHLRDKTSVTYKGKIVDVSGGFHDAGDHDKFGLPQGYTASILGIGYYEFKDAYEETGQTEHFKTILDYFCDYFVRCTVLDSNGNAEAFCYQVGDGASHHQWVSAEKENIDRPAYFADSSTPATDQVSEAVAALAIHYVNFGNEIYLEYAEKLFAMAQRNGKQKQTDAQGGAYYGSSSWEDDYCLAAAWLYKATKKDNYLNEYKKYESQVDTGADPAWDQVGPYAVAYGGNFSPLAANASQKINSATKVSNGYAWISQWGSARYNCNIQLEGLVYDKNSGKEQQYTEWATGQMKFLLGNSADKRCYVVGYNANSSKYPHHRTAAGYSDWPNNGNNHTVQAHVLLGALVGGIENTSGTYHDDSNDYYCNEVAIDYNAAFVGAAAGLYLANKNNPDIQKELASEEELTAIGVTKYYGTPSAVKVPVESVSLDKTALTLDVAQTAKLTTTVLPVDASNKKVTWTSSDSKVATVSGGTVTAVAPGTAAITVTTSDGEKTATCTVTVNKKKITSVIFPTVSGKVTAGTALKNVTLSKTSDEYGTFAWENPNTIVTGSMTGANVVYTLKDSTNVEIAPEVLGVNAAGNTVARMVPFTVAKKKATIIGPDRIQVNAGTELKNVPVTGYSTDGIKGSFVWNEASRKLTSLDNGKQFILVFIPDDQDSYDSAQKSVSFEVKKIQNTKIPVVPELLDKTADSVTLKVYEGEEAVQYGIKSGAGSYSWRDSNEFTGLSPYATYTFAQRFAADDIYEASEASAVLDVTTYFLEEDCYKIDLTKISDKYVEAHNGTIAYDNETKTVTLLKKDSYIITGGNENITLSCGNAPMVVLDDARLKKLDGDSDIVIKLIGDNEIMEGVRGTGKVTVQNGSETANAGMLTVSGNSEGAVYAENVVIEGGQVTAVGSGTAAAVKAKDMIELLGGSLKANAEGDVTPIQATTIILDGCQVQSDAEKVYSPNPVDKNGEAVIPCIVIYKDGEKELGRYSVKKGSEIVLANLDKKAGYKAEGWKTEGSDEVLISGAKAAVTDDITYLAEYIEITGSLAVEVEEEDTPLTLGYVTDTGLTVTVTNDTNVTLDEVKVLLDSDEDFTVSHDSLKALPSGASAEVYIKLKNGKGVNIEGYKVILSVCSDELEAVIEKEIIRTVKKAQAEKPEEKPTVVAKTAQSITILPVEGAEYGIRNADGTFEWQESPIFEGLKPYTVYTFAIRYKATDDQEAGEASETVDLRTLMSLEERYVVDVSQLGDKDYVEAHGSTISVEGNTLILKEEEIYRITGKNPNLTIQAEGNVTIILDNAEVAGIKGNKDVIIRLAGDSKILSNADGISAIEVAGTIVISKEEDAQQGSVIIQGGKEAVGIDADKVIIESGTVTVTGGDGAAGINAGDVMIAGGNVTITGGAGNTAGIDANKVTITGGTVSVTGQGDKPAIKADSKDIKIEIKETNGTAYREPDKEDKKKLVESITVTISSATIIKDRTATVSAMVLPTDAADKSVIWSSSNPSVATVSQNGIVTAVLEGKTDIIATAKDGSGKSGQVAVTVVDNGQGDDDKAVQATGMTVEADVKGAKNIPVKGTFKLAPKKKMELNVIFLPEDAVEEELTFTSKNVKIAKVDENGIITAGKKAGKTTITVTSENGLKKTFTVQVMKKPIKRVKIKVSKKVVKVKKKLKLKAVLTPNKKQASNVVYWKSSNPKVAVVSASGVVKGVKKGKAKITAVATDGSGKKATVTIQVK
ncbi:MAG: glycoside hydrolase family 9 protein [Lachnospiraceae bacterium]|nr:glycoside hydrolase family 9 protein [Lachnospiraceae bacterium]